MNKRKLEKKKILIISTVLSIVLVLLFFFSMCVGRYKIPLTDVFKVVFGNTEVDDMNYMVITRLRIPRTLVAIIVGAGLSLAGIIYQSIFNNKLVSPDLLGASSGAGVGACIAILLGLSSVSITIISFVSGILAVLITLVLSKSIKNNSMTILLLAGIIISGLMDSIIGLIKFIADSNNKLEEITFWLLGDLSKATMNDFWKVLPIFIICSITAIIYSRVINIISLGDKDARSLGTEYKRDMIILIIVATLLTSAMVSISGIIGWVGLVIPHIARLFIGNDNQKAIPLTILIGAIFMVIVDILARTLAPSEIPLSIITGILGTPLFIIAIIKKRREIR